MTRRQFAFWLGFGLFNLADRLSLFTEASIGPRMAVVTATDGQASATQTQFGLGYGLRLGVNYTLR